MNENISNEGVEGLDSIRLGGMTRSGLPMAEEAQVKGQWADVQKNDNQNKINAIKEKYPKQTSAWVEGAIRDCEATIVNVQRLLVEQQAMIVEYSVLIGECDRRDEKLAKTDDKEIIKALRLEYPPYDVPKMKSQIVQCNEAIDRSNVVIKKEYDAIAELKELLRQCMIRDVELKQYGIEV